MADGVNLLIHEGAQYLVAPRGETQWVRNYHPVFRIAPVVAARVLTGGAGQPAATPDAASES